MAWQLQNVNQVPGTVRITNTPGIGVSRNNNHKRGSIYPNNNKNNTRSGRMPRQHSSGALAAAFFLRACHGTQKQGHVAMALVEPGKTE